MSVGAGRGAVEFREAHELHFGEGVLAIANVLQHVFAAQPRGTEAVDAREEVVRRQAMLADEPANLLQGDGHGCAVLRRFAGHQMAAVHGGDNAFYLLQEEHRLLRVHFGQLVTDARQRVTGVIAAKTFG